METTMNRITPRTLCWAALALGAMLVAALPAAARQADLTLDQVVAKHYEAIGGKDAWKSLQGMKQTGKLSMAGMEAPFTAYSKRPNKQRSEFEIQGMKGVQVFDGADGWMVMPFMGSNDPQPMPKEMVDLLASNADIEGVLVDWAAKGHQVELVGKEDVEGTPAYRLRVKLQGGSQVDYLLDAEHFVTLQMRTKATFQGTEMEVVSNLSNYKEVGGLMIPHSMSTTSPMGEQVVTFDVVEVNLAIDDSLFVKPAAAPPGAH
jgi:outer membrane lipoprotein-sorting protein